MGKIPPTFFSFSHHHRQSHPQSPAHEAVFIARLSGRMSSPEALIPAVFSGQELLAFDEDQLVRFLNECRTPGNDFDISRVLGLDGLSKGQQGEFSEKLR